MTTVMMLERSPRRARVAELLRWAVLVCLALGRPAAAQDRPVHWLNAGVMPPGAIGSLRLQRGGPLLGYFQPVRIRAPEGARIALAAEAFDESYFGDALVGLQIGPVYRLMVVDIPNNAGLEVYPTIELIDRLYPPPGMSLRFPIPIELTQDELELAARGSFVTRVVYVEDPQTALPVVQPAKGEQSWIEAPPGEDPLVTADERGRAVAILRIGSRVPSAEAQAVSNSEPPPFVQYDAYEADGTCISEGYTVDEQPQMIDSLIEGEQPIEVEGAIEVTKPRDVDEPVDVEMPVEVEAESFPILPPQ